MSTPASPQNPENPRNRFSRRRMLQLLGLGATGAAIATVAGTYAYRRSYLLSAREAERISRMKIVVVGGSIAGLTVAARILRGVPEANITVIEPRREHHYQPGYTLVGAGIYKPEKVLFNQQDLMLPGLQWIADSVSQFEPDRNRVITASGETVAYDFLVVATGVTMDLNSVEGLTEALQTPYVANIYDLKSSSKFHQLASEFSGGKAVFTYPQGYVKCGGAPQKIAWLSEDLWRQANKRDSAEIHFFTPQHSLFPVVPVIDEIVKPMMEARGLNNHYHHALRAIDVSTRTAIFEEVGPDGGGREVRQAYDLLHPMGRFQTPLPLRRSDLTREGLGGQVEVDRNTLLHKRYSNIFAVGDCAGTGAPKTAATVRKQAPVVALNLFDLALDREPSHFYDGTSGCPLLTRYGRCMMFEFDFQGRLVNEWLYQSTRETRLWWEFKVHGLRRLYRHVMLNGWV